MIIKHPILLCFFIFLLICLPHHVSHAFTTISTVSNTDGIHIHQTQYQLKIPKLGSSLSKRGESGFKYKVGVSTQHLFEMNFRGGAIALVAIGGLVGLAAMVTVIVGSSIALKRGSPKSRFGWGIASTVLGGIGIITGVAIILASLNNRMGVWSTIPFGLGALFLGLGIPNIVFGRRAMLSPFYSTQNNSVQFGILLSGQF